MSRQSCIQSLSENLFMVSDPRIESKEVYPLDFLFLIVFLSTLSGDTSGTRLKIMQRNTKKC
ncbi:hypothetical protein PGA7_00004130 [Porphyromonas gingivalis]|nr:hypothetical protein PGA7_00004130 [Porphyromonas gingivalis]